MTTRKISKIEKEEIKTYSKEQLKTEIFRYAIHNSPRTGKYKLLLNEWRKRY